MDDSKRITITNNTFTLGGKRIWISGANVPWHKWNDFGGAYDNSWWDGHFAKLHGVGINAVRVWVNCNNDQNAVDIGEDGIIRSVSNKHWEDLDQFFMIAERRQIYIKATLLSFDHFKDTGKRPAALRWRAMLNNDEAVASFAERYTIPFVRRYGDNPWLWCVDLINEPDWIYENNECGQLPWERISYFLAANAAAVHEHSKTLVTIGLSFPKYNADGPNCQGNKASDAFLQSLYPNENAYMDFWSTHYYDWVGRYYGVPFYSKPSGPQPEGYGLDGTKPALIGECSAKGSANHTLTEDFENTLKNGWQGIMPWTANGVDANGGFDEVAPAARHMLELHRDIIFP